jgi:hypothetical protein
MENARIPRGVDFGTYTRHAPAVGGTVTFDALHQRTEFYIDDRLGSRHRYVTVAVVGSSRPHELGARRVVPDRP